MIHLRRSQNQTTSHLVRLALRAFCLVFLLALWGSQGLAVRVQAQAVRPPVHTIQAGESLSEISELYGVALNELMELNGIQEPDTILEGQRLRLTPMVDTGLAREVALEPSRVALAEDGPTSAA